MPKNNFKRYTDDLESKFGVSSLGWLEPLHENFDNIEKRMKFYVEENVKLREENDKLKSEHYKDKELKNIEEKLEKLKSDLYRGFPIYENEEEAIKKWQKAHAKKMHPQPKTKKIRKYSGYSFGYEFVPFELGIAETCYCTACRERALTESKGDIEKYKKLLKKYDAEFDFDYI